MTLANAAGIALLFAPFIILAIKTILAGYWKAFLTGLGYSVAFIAWLIMVDWLLS